MHSILRRLTALHFGFAVPTAGPGVLASAATIAGAFWVTVTLPNLPLVHAFGTSNGASVNISLQSALLGIDDGRSVRGNRALEHKLGLSSYTLPSPEQLRALATSPAAATLEPPPVVAQLDVAPAPQAPVDVPSPLAPSPPSAPSAPVQPVSTPPVEPQPPVHASTPSPPVSPPRVTLPTPPAVKPPAPAPPAAVVPPITTPPVVPPPVTPPIPDTAPPWIASHADIHLDATGPSGIVATYTRPTATDAVEGAVAVTCAPASGSLFALGSTTVTCSAHDSSHNAASSSFAVIVADLSGPTISVPASAQVGPTSPAGIVVSFTATASDLVDGAIAPSCAPASGSLFAVGHTTVTCTAQDAAHNSTTESFDVHVLADTIAPSLQTHGNLTLEATGSAGAAATFTAPAASDLVDGGVATSCAPASGSVFALGHTTVTCTAEDSSHNAATTSFDVQVEDTTAPSIQSSSNLTAEAAPGGAVVAYSAPTATDTVDGSVAVSCAPASGSTFSLGHTTVNCSASDAAGNGASSHFDVFVRDTTAPVIQSHVNLTADATGAGGATVTYTTPTGSDSLDGAVAVSCAPASGSTFALGHTTVNCTATDAAGNTGHSSFDVHVVDTTAPTVQTHVNLTAEAASSAGATVAYTSPTASDTVSGALGANCLPASGSTFALGHSTVTCTATDAAGNAGTSSFDVLVRDTTSPTIAAHANVVAEATASGGAGVSYSLPSASDLVDSSVAVTCLPASGSTFALGHTTVSCSAHDAAGNTAAGTTFDVNVRDTTGPAIASHSNLVVEATGPSGAPVTYTVPAATDLVTGAATVNCAPASGSTFALGHTTVTCSSQDAAHNQSTSTFDVLVRDTTAPVLNVPADFTVQSGSSSGQAVTFTVTATDSVDGSVAVTCSPASGSVFPVGHTTVSCSAHDAAGNTATDTSLDVFLTTSQVVHDGVTSMFAVNTVLTGFGLPQSVLSSLQNQLLAAGISWVNGDAVTACQNLDVFDASASTQLTGAQYSQLSPSMADTRTILGC